MSPVDPTSQMRLKAHYTGPLGSHTMLFHRNAGASEGDFIAGAREIIDSMALIQFTDTSWNNAELAEAGSSLFFPISWTPIVQLAGEGPSANDGEGKFFQFGGRGPDGVRVKWYLFEVYIQITTLMRYSLGDLDPVDSIIATLVANANKVGSVSGASYSTYSYANVGFNDHLVKKART